MTHSCARTPIGRARRETYQLPPVALPTPSHDEIARLAYAYWEARGRQHGCHEEDWYRAERELLRRRPFSELRRVV
jgi:hypothetical protein